MGKKQMYFREQALETIGRNVLYSYSSSYFSLAPQPVPIETIIERNNLRIEYKHLMNDESELGRIVYDTGYTIIYNPEMHEYEPFWVEAGTILIDASLLTQENYGRMRFTLAHELAHWLIHKRVFEGTGEAASMFVYDEDSSIEWQANKLAAAIMMPLFHVKRYFYSLACKGMNDNDKISEMASVFEVSKQAMRIRLEEHCLI